MAEVEPTLADLRAAPARTEPFLKRAARSARELRTDASSSSVEPPQYADGAFVVALLDELQALPALASAHVHRPLVVGAPAATLPLLELERALLQTARCTGDASLGLTVALNTRTALLPGQSEASACPTVREALAALSRTGLPLEGVTLTLLEHGSIATVRCASLRGYPAIDRFFSEFFLATLLQLFGELHPHVRVDVQRALFAHAAAPLEDRHARAFRAPVLFNQRAHALRFARRLLDLPRHPLEPPSGADQAPLVLAVRGGALPVSERVRAWLGTCSSLSAIDASSVARALGLTQRALRRRLASDGTSLSALADEVRCRIAREGLARDLPIDVIVEQTGFRERSGFFRAFKRWTGRTPSHFRGTSGSPR